MHLHRKLHRTCGIGRRGVVVLATFCLLLACKKNPGDAVDPPGADLQKKKILVLNEGLLNLNNAGITAVDPDDGKLIEADLFKRQNNRGLGDTGSDLAMYGGKIYVVVNISSQIEVIDQTGKSLKQIPVFTEDQKPRQPRFIAFSGNKAYVCCFDGTVVRIDTASLAIDAVAKAGSNPDGICVANGKLYVSNSGGLDFPNYDSTVSVMDIATFKEIGKIVVRINPYTIAADAYGDVYVVSRGNYKDIKYCLQRINTATDELAQTFSLETLSFVISKDIAYCYNYDFTTKTSSYSKLNVKTEETGPVDLITDGTTIKAPYAIAVDPESEDVYITDGQNFTVNGDLYCFGKDGKMKFKTETGINPGKILFTR